MASCCVCSHLLICLFCLCYFFLMANFSACNENKLLSIKSLNWIILWSIMRPINKQTCSVVFIYRLLLHLIYFGSYHTILVNYLLLMYNRFWLICMDLLRIHPKVIALLDLFLLEKNYLRNILKKQRNKLINRGEGNTP